MNKKKLFGLNKVTFFFLMIYILVGIGVTYAYFAFRYEDTSTIVGNVISIDADLTVERIVGTDEKLVPMVDDALANALNGVGSDNGACIDSLGNLSCQVYKITLTNNSSRLQHLVGTIELYPKSGSGNAYSNLKWQKLIDQNTVNEGAIVNGMSKSILVSGLTLESKESKTWYVGVWLSEVDSDQRNIDKGEFGGMVTFEVIDGVASGIVGNFYNDFLTNVLEPNASSDVSIDFSETSEQSGTNGIYVRNNTVDDPYPIYYYRGNVNNNLIFADYCWKVVRTTETGGLKLVYNGAPTNGTCNNTGEDSLIISNSSFNESTSLAHIGYMYGDVYEYSIKDFSNDTTEYIYGNDVSYVNGSYKLTGDVKSETWSSLGDAGLDNNHYTCFTINDECSSVYYIYYTDLNTAYYITLNDGKTLEEAINKMLNYNTYSSIIKGNKDINGTVDYWYYLNIKQEKYNSYLEDTVWCNDRSINDLGGWNPNGGSTKGHLYFSGRNRLETGYSPDLTCVREIDRFTVNPSNGNGNLDYPIGLLTADEVMLAGATFEIDNNLYYLENGNYYWLGTPYAWDNFGDRVFTLYPSGSLGYDNKENVDVGIRPSISLKNGFKLIGDGDGTSSKPYVVDTTNKDKLINVIVNFDANGGSVELSNKELVTYEEYGELPIPERDGHTFMGWYNERVGGRKITEGSIVNGSETLFARWSANTYTVTFNTNGIGTTSITSKTVMYDSVYGELPILSMEGYVFNGWYTEESGGEKVTSESIVKIGENHILYARWTPFMMFVNGLSGIDSNDGTTPDASLLTLKQAYKNLKAISDSDTFEGTNKGIIYIVDRVNITDAVTLSDNSYIDTTETVNFTNRISISMRRYSQPTTVNTGYSTVSNTGYMLNVESTGNLTLGNILIDGHDDEYIGTINQTAPAVTTGTSIILVNGGTLNVDGATLQNNVSTTYGGAIYNYGGILTVNSGTITGNSTTNYGGGIFIVENGLATIAGGIISNNTGTHGGGVMNYVGETTITGGTIRDNTASTTGAGFYVYSGTLNFKGGTITSNSAAVSGGGMCNSGTVNFRGGTITNNTSVNSGGGIINTGTVNITNTALIDQNTSSTTGGGIINTGTINLTGGSITGNTAETYGGGIINYGTIDFKNGTISNNIATTKFGGGIQNQGTITMSGGTVTGNESIASGGGGINNVGDACVMTMTGGLVTNNKASTYGGGIMVGCPLTMLGGTITSNDALYGGGVFVSSAVFDFANGEISSNTSSSGGGIRINIGQVNISGGIIKDNTGMYGGGISSTIDGIIELSGGEIKNNTADRGGGILSDGTITMLGGIISENDATDDVGGGGILVSNTNSVLTMSGGLITSNTAMYGAGVKILASTGKMVMTGGTISNNISSSSGAGIYNYGILEISYSSKIIGNNSSKAGGGVYNSGTGTLTMSGTVEINNNVAETHGGGVMNHGTMDMQAGSIIQNIASTKSGGGIQNQGTLTVSGGTISENTAYNSGGGVNTSSEGSSMVMTGGYITGNSSINGGGINVNSTSSLNISGGTISNNTGTTDGGGIYNYGILTISGTTDINNNTAESYGGGIINFGTVNMQGGKINSNKTLIYSGGGVYNSSSFIISDGEISSNISSNHGGGVYNNGTLTISSNAKINNNETLNEGGGIYNNSILELNGGELKNNYTTATNGLGGGIYNNHTITMTSGLISANYSYRGGGMYNTAQATTNISGGSITGNTAQSYGGGIYNIGTLNLTDGIVSGNVSNASSEYNEVYREQ